MKNEKLRDSACFLLLIVVIFCIYQYGRQKLVGFTIYQDEFGYWANAATFLGYRWKEIISLGPYYSFGYSILLMPILFFIHDSVRAYRIAIFLNAGMLIASAFFLWKIMQNWYVKDRKQDLIIITACAVLTPTWIVYMQMTLSEICLMFLFILLVFLMQRLFREGSSFLSLVTGLLLGFVFWVHMRSIGVIFAGVITIVVWIWKQPERRKDGKIILLSLFAMIIAAVLLKNRLMESAYSLVSPTQLGANDIDGQIGKIKQIFTIAGLGQFLLECMGKFFYLVLSTAGTVCWAALALCKRLKHFLTEKSYHEEALLTIFLLLSLVSEFLICVVAMFGGTRIDHIVYGRYMEFVFPIFIAIGIHEMITMRKVFRKSGILLVLCGLAVPIINYLIESRKATEIVGYFTVGISYLLDEKNFQKDIFFIKAYLFGALTLLVVTLLIFLIQKSEVGISILLLLVLLEIYGGLFVSTKYNYTFNASVSSDIRVFDQILIEEKEDTKIFYLYEGREAAINNLQFYKRDSEIQITTLEEVRKQVLPRSCILILDSKSDYLKEMEKLYPNYRRSSNFIILNIE